MSDLIEGFSEAAERNVQMIGVCLQQLVFTTHNILEMSKIRQKRFKPTTKEINVAEKLENIFDFFKEDMRKREIDCNVKIEDQLSKYMLFIDEGRFSIVLYNLISNSVKHTSGGLIKVSVKILDQTQMDLMTRKCKTNKKKRDE